MVCDPGAFGYFRLVGAIGLGVGQIKLIDDNASSTLMLGPKDAGDDFSRHEHTQGSGKDESGNYEKVTPGELGRCH
jgi:hypothetical protein